MAQLPSRRRATLRELFSIDLRSLAALRVALALLLLADLITRAPYIRLHHSADGLWPSDAVDVPWHFSLYQLGGLKTAVCLHAVAALFALLLLVGWRTRLATAVSWFLLVSLQVRNPLLTNNGDILLRMLLLWSLFVPLGARWSLDARRPRGRHELHEPGPPASVFSAGTVALLLQFVFVYLAAGIVKSTPPWRDGTAVQLFLGNETLGRPLGTALREHPAWTTAITYATPPFEILGALLLFLPWRTASVRLMLLPCFWFFQLGLGTCLQLQLFPWAATASTLPFLPTQLWERCRRLFRRGTPSATEEPLASTKRTPLARVLDVVVALLLAYTAFLNSPTLLQQDEWEGVERMAPARLLGIVQSWRLYSVVPRKETSFEIVAQRANGRVVDVLDLPEDETGRWLRRVHGEYRLKHQLLLMARRYERYGPLLRHHLDWICREWNTSHTEQQAFRRLQMVRIERDITVDGVGRPERMVIAEHECPAAMR